MYVYRNNSTAELRMKTELSQAAWLRKGHCLPLQGAFTHGNRELWWSECAVVNRGTGWQKAQWYMPVRVVQGWEGHQGCSSHSLLHSE